MNTIRSFNSQKRIEFLLHVGEVLNSSLDYHKNLVDIALLMTPNLADWCSVDILDENGDLQRLAVSHIDPEKIEYAYELYKKYPPEKNYKIGPYKVVATGQSDFYPYIHEDLVRKASIDEEHFQISMALGLRSAMAVPLKAADKTFGVLTLITSETKYNYTKEDLYYVEELARRAGLAIENSRLYTQAKILSDQMEAQKEKLDDIISNVPGIVWEIWNPSAVKKKNFISMYFEEMLGYSREEWQEDPEFIYKIIHPEDRANLGKDIESDLKNAIMKPANELRLLKKDGSVIWVESKSSTIYNSAGEPIGIRGITTDISARKKIEERLKSVVESSPNSLLMINEEGIITLVNVQAEKLFGYLREELIGTNIEIILSVSLSDLLPGGKGVDGIHRRDIFGLKKHGSKVPVEIGLNPITMDEGVFILCSVVDISERRKIESKIEASLKEKEVLLKEIHHRVKNNLQIISSLLNLQASLLSDEKIVNALTESQNRIRSMALIHEKLYQTMDLSRINFKDYVEELLNNLFDSYQSTSRISKDLLIDEIYLNVDVAISLGLIINELVTNSFKYAFPDKKGIISIIMQSANGMMLLEVGDNGIGLPGDFDICNANSLGLQLVLSLVEQVNGNVETDISGGTKFIITCPHR
jgi:two-component system, sensor histidine kinase PdtaS